MQSLSGRNPGSNSDSRVKTERRFYYGWVVLATCFIIGVINHGTRWSFGVFFKSLETEFSLTRALTSEIFSVYMVLSGLFAIVGGWALDRYGPKAVVATMGFFIGLSLLLTSHANTLWYLLVSYSLLLAIGTGPAHTIIMSTTSKWFIRRRGLAIGIVSSGISLGIMVISPVAAWLIASFGWQTSYFIMAVIAFSIITPCAFLLKKAPTDVVDLPEDERLNATKLSTSSEQRRSQLDGLSLIQATKTKNFHLLFLTNFLIAFCMFAVNIHIVPHAIDLGFTSVQAASILSLIGGTSIPGTLLMGRASDSIGRKQATVICALLMGGAMLCLIKASSLWMLYLFAVIFGFSRGGINPPLVALVGDTFGLSHIGVIMAVTGIGWTVGAAVGPTFAGYIFDINGDYIVVFLAGMIALLITAVLIPFVRAPKPSTREKVIW